MMQFLEFTFSDLPHFIGVVILLFVLGLVTELVVVGFGNALRGLK
jgi:hypothetical protein